MAKRPEGVGRGDDPLAGSLHDLGRTGEPIRCQPHPAYRAARASSAPAATAPNPTNSRPRLIVHHRLANASVLAGSTVELSNVEMSRPGNRLHALKGDRQAQFAIAVNEQWRVCFRVADGDAVLKQHARPNALIAGELDDRFDLGARRTSSAKSRWSSRLALALLVCLPAIDVPVPPRVGFILSYLRLFVVVLLWWFGLRQWTGHQRSSGLSRHRLGRQTA